MKIRNKFGNVYSGTIGKSKTAVVRDGANFSRTWVMPYDPKTPKQRRMRELYKQGHDAWIALPQAGRDSYNERARGFPFTGYNLFIKEFVAKELAKNPL